MLFSEIQGATLIKKKLINAVQNNHVAHAQMFVGREGGTNLAVALAYATYINCENQEEGDACGNCSSCEKMKKLVHPDVHFVFPMYSLGSGDKEKAKNELLATFRAFILENPYANLIDWANYSKAENKQLSISVEESRKIIGNISMKAFEGRYKIVLIWLPELMNTQASNAILKALEEPPAQTLFFLVTNDLDKNIITIRSRTQAVKFPLSTEEEISNTLIKRFNTPEKLAKSASYFSEGSINEALKYSKEVKDDNFALFKEWMRFCYKLDFTSLVKFAEDFPKLPKAQQKGFFQFGMSVIRNILLIHSGSEELVKIDEEEKTFVKNLSTVMSIDKLSPIEEQFNDAFYHLERNASPKIECMNAAFSVIKIIRKK